MRELLKNSLQVSYEYIMNYIKENNKKPNNIPEEYKEYIDFYKGDEKDTFILKLISKNNDKFIVKDSEEPIVKNSENLIYKDNDKLVAKDIIVDDVEGKEKEAVVKVRVNQSKFRENLIKKNPCCKICGMSNISLLIASHIKSWKESNSKEKLDINNGLLLCPNHDLLFDKHLISFNVNGKIIISESISDQDKEKLNINDNIVIDLDKEQLEYINYHREKFFEIEEIRVNL